MKIVISVLTATAILLTGSAVTQAQAPAAGYEPEPVLNAKDLATPELLKGPHFTVDNRVPINGFLARFTIRSTYGTFDAHGIHMFQIRVKEVYALTQLDGMSKTKDRKSVV